MRKIMTSSTLKNLPGSRQIDVGCFKIGLGDNGISRFGGKDYGGLLIQNRQLKFVRLNFTSARSLVYINNQKSCIELTTFARQNRIVYKSRHYVVPLQPQRTRQCTLEATRLDSCTSPQSSSICTTIIRKCFVRTTNKANMRSCSTLRYPTSDAATSRYIVSNRCT